VAGYRFSGEV